MTSVFEVLSNEETWQSEAQGKATIQNMHQENCPLFVSLYSTLRGIPLNACLSNMPAFCSSLSQMANVLLLKPFNKEIVPFDCTNVDTYFRVRAGKCRCKRCIG